MTATRLAYRVPEAAEQLGISERQTWREIARGSLRAVKAGRVTLVSAQAMADWLATLETETARVGRDAA